MNTRSGDPHALVVTTHLDPRPTGRNGAAMTGLTTLEQADAAVETPAAPVTVRRRRRRRFAIGVLIAVIVATGSFLVTRAIGDSPSTGEAAATSDARDLVTASETNPSPSGDAKDLVTASETNPSPSGDAKDLVTASETNPSPSGDAKDLVTASETNPSPSGDAKDLVSPATR
jgi:hypothetical protein